MSHSVECGDGGLTHRASRNTPAAGICCGTAKLGVRLVPHHDPMCHSGHQHSRFCFW